MMVLEGVSVREGDENEGQCGRGQSDGAWVKVVLVIQDGTSAVMMEGATCKNKDRCERNLW